MRVIFLMCFLLLTACASATTQLSGVVDPTYKGVTQTKVILIIGLYMSIEEQRMLEDTFQKTLQQHNVRVLKGLDVFPPTREYGNVDLFEIAKSKGADTILIVRNSNRNVSEQYVAYHHFFKELGMAYTTGHYIYSPNMSFDIYLKSTKSKETIWYVNGFSSGNEFTSFNHLVGSAAKSIVRELGKEGLIGPKEK